MWENDTLIQADDYNVRWYKRGKMNIIASDGEMKRAAVDTWASMVHRAIDSVADDETLYLLLDLTGDKQGTTPYSMKITRDIARSVADDRAGNTYAAVLMKNPLLVGFIQAFFHQHFARQEKLIYRLFTDTDEALTWIDDEITTHAEEG